MVNSTWLKQQGSGTSSRLFSGEQEAQSDFTNAYAESDQQTADQSNLYGLNQTFDMDDGREDESYYRASSPIGRSYHDQCVYEQPQSSVIVPDATRRVHEKYEQLLNLLSNPEDFAAVVNSGNLNPVVRDSLLPYQIFASDVEVVLPQALTASQLFGIEQTDGIELEAAAGIVQISQLFMRWLALMPGADHSNLINPPGLTVMRILGGKYRVTAAHRVIWQWLNEFLPDPLCQSESTIKFGDLVSMTIVDVFETDLDGRLLSYCPTFDNRCLTKTYPTIERFHKETNKLFNTVHIVRQSGPGRSVERAATSIYKYAEKAAQSVAETVKGTISKQVTERSGANTSTGVIAQQASSTSAYMSFKNKKNNTASQTLKDAIALSSSSPTEVSRGPQLEYEKERLRSPDYLSDDDTSADVTASTR